LEALKIGAIWDGDPRSAQWDTRIREAQEDESLAAGEIRVLEVRGGRMNRAWGARCAARLARYAYWALNA